MGITDFMSEEDLQRTISIEKRNEQSLDYLYDKYSPALYGIIYRITNDKQLAEDCLMETFLKAWNEIMDFKCSDTSLFNWLLLRARQSAFEGIKKVKEKNSGSHNFVHVSDQQNCAFELVYMKGLTIEQAAELSRITIIELKKNIRMDLQNMKEKKVES